MKRYPACGFLRLLYEPEKLSGKVPVVLNVNGHERTGVSTPYIQMRCINLAKRGMLALNFEWYGMGQLSTENFHHYRSNQIDLTGTSGIALHYLAQTPGDRRAAGAPECRSAAARSHRPVRRRLADDLHQFARHSREAGESGRGILELCHALAVS